jgi:hypothetical protein
MNNPIIYAPLVSRRIQAIRQDSETGDIFIHTTQGFVHIWADKGKLYHGFIPAEKRQEPLVIPAK